MGPTVATTKKSHEEDTPKIANAKEDQEDSCGSGSANQTQNSARLSFAKGENVEVQYDGQWYSGQVVHSGDSAKTRVTVDGTEYDIEDKDIRRKDEGACPETGPDGEPKRENANDENVEEEVKEEEKKDVFPPDENAKEEESKDEVL